jgi:hypothetical protein
MPYRQQSNNSDLITQILAHPAFRAMVGAADPYMSAMRGVNTVTNPFNAAASVAGHLAPGNPYLKAYNSNPEDELDPAIANARMATGRTNPDLLSNGLRLHGKPLTTDVQNSSPTSGPGTDYYRSAGTAASALFGFSRLPEAATSLRDAGIPAAAIVGLPPLAISALLSLLGHSKSTQSYKR